MEYYLISSKNLENKKYFANSSRNAAKLAFKDIKKLNKTSKNVAILLKDMNGGYHHYIANQKGGKDNLENSISELSKQLEQNVNSTIENKNQLIQDEIKKTIEQIKNNVDENVYTKNAIKTEKELEKIIPKKHWKNFNQLFVGFGQQICLPRKPKCDICKLKNKCNFYKNL